jgi:membrane-associated protein
MGWPALGVFLSGDTLFFPAGLACSHSVPGAGRLSVPLMLVCAGVGFLAGAQTWFLLGRRRAGRPMRLRRPDGRGRDCRRRADALFVRYGPRRAIALGRFVSGIRILVDPAAGLLSMPSASFTLWQAVAGLAWSEPLALAGYALGESGRHGTAYLVTAVAAVVVVGVLLTVVQWVRARRIDRARSSRIPRCWWRAYRPGPNRAPGGWGAGDWLACAIQ